jgi:3-deoxy-D-manno-octulosonate 8-phosphate phosphatase (KDO 8-P phosphatase)
MAKTDDTTSASIPDGAALARIELLVLDVDGVLTDGRITLSESGQEIKSFHAKDGAGMKYWKRVGKKLAIISGRGSPVIAHRANELGVDVLRIGAKDKLPVYREILAELGVSDEQVAVVGDDLTDLPILRQCGFPVAPADAVDEVKAAATYVTRLPGGAGCVREIIELILKHTGRWAEIMARYLPARSASADPSRPDSEE